MAICVVCGSGVCPQCGICSCNRWHLSNVLPRECMMREHHDEYFLAGYEVAILHRDTSPFAAQLTGVYEKLKMTARNKNVMIVGEDSEVTRRGGE